MQKPSISREAYVMELNLAFYSYGTCDSSGRIVTPACPPTTGTSTSLGSRPRTSACTRLEKYQILVFKSQLKPNGVRNH